MQGEEQHRHKKERKKGINELIISEVRLEIEGHCVKVCFN